MQCCSSHHGFFSTHLLDIVPVLDRVHDGSKFLVNSEFASNTGKRSQNIGKENASIGLVVSPRLEGDLNGNLGNFTSLTEGRVLLAKIAVFLDVTTGLSHHPDWSSFDLLALGGTDQERILGVGGSLGVLRDSLVNGTLDDGSRRRGAGIGGESLTGQSQGKKNCCRELHGYFHSVSVFWVDCSREGYEIPIVAYGVMRILGLVSARMGFGVGKRRKKVTFPA